MFADEAKLAAQLSHPNVVHIHDLGKIDAGGYFIAMEYVDGRDLRAILHSAREVSTPMPVPLALYVASKVASALDYAHRRRDPGGKELAIVHRDVSPQNILISYEGEIKLCDFGIAKAASKASKTQSGALKGKIQYMSPEQAWGKPIDRRSDLFSLGVVLHELLTGERLFRGDSDINVLEKVRLAEVAPPSRANPEVPHNLDAVVLKALAREPDERYANASDLLRDLDSVLYSYTPAPGSADVAIYLHRLQAEEGAVAEAKAREVAQAAEESDPEPARKRKSKGAPVSRKATAAPRITPVPAAAPPPASPPPTPPPPAAPVPASSAPSGPEVFGSLEAKSAEGDKASRTPLIAAIVVAAAALIGFFSWRSMKPGGKVAPVPTPAVAAATAVPTSVAAPAPVPTAVPAGIDPKAVEAEVQRQLAAKRKELERTATAGKAAASAEAAPAPAAAPALVEPTALPTLPPTPVPIPTAAPTEPPAAPVEAPKPAPAREPETQRGDLVGPGTGVVEPALISPPRVVYPPIARQQRVEGKVVVLVLVDENGKVTEARIQQGLSQAAVNDAVLAGVKGAKFRAATKNGTPVKMWRPIIVDVKP
jgi:eukaryotic-like serine/threonine-protein kinase